jgi:hypothetical protein
VEQIGSLLEPSQVLRTGDDLLARVAAFLEIDPPRMSRLAACATKASCVAAVMIGMPERIVSQRQTSNDAGVATFRERGDEIGVGPLAPARRTGDPAIR